jgi:hypothetical protein
MDMKSRHLSAMSSAPRRRPWRSLPWLAALLLLWAASAAFAQQPEADPPARVGYVSLREGSVVFAPDGEDEWMDLPHNRPLTVGDRLWTDRGSRAEVQLGTATLHLDEETHLGFGALDDRVSQMLLQRGSANARVRELAPDENFEIGTPNLAFRALRPGDYRVDVDPQGITRVTVASGYAAVFGERGESLELGAGQQLAFSGRQLARVDAPRPPQDAFAAWAAERNRIEDQSLAARYVPRGVIGYPQLDPYGSWSHDPAYGAIWFPRITVQDWAPYRYGHWQWIPPWGWTWVDDAPWGFAPFHYGRWTMIGNRWAWVPGRLAPRPVYAPALVVFLGGGDARFSFTVGSGPGVGWYPLAPGEAWWPTYRTSPRYLGFVNFNINLNASPRNDHNHFWRRRPFAVTAVREDDFRRALPVHRFRQAVQPYVIEQALAGVAPPRPDGRRERDRDAGRAPRLQAPAPTAPLPRQFPRIGEERRGSGPEEIVRQREELLRQQQERVQRDARPLRQEQERRGDDLVRRREELLRQQQERSQRDARQQEALRQQQDRVRQEQERAAQRDQQDRAREAERLRREQEGALRERQQRAQRDAQERAQQLERANRERERMQRDQARAQAQQERAQAQQERAQRQQERAQSEALRRLRDGQDGRDGAGGGGGGGGGGGAGGGRGGAGGRGG